MVSPRKTTSSTQTHGLYRTRDHHRRREAELSCRTCYPAFSCPGGTMVRGGLEGVLTPVCTRLQNGWCCGER